MFKKLTVISLSLVTIQSILAKPAPQNTFRFPEAKTRTQVSIKVRRIQDKIDDLRASGDNNFIVDKINEFRISRLESELAELSRE